MSNMLEATEKAKPVMEYVNRLETLVRKLRQEKLQARVDRSVTFVLGAASGCVFTLMVVAAVWFVSHR